VRKKKKKRRQWKGRWRSEDGGSRKGIDRKNVVTELEKFFLGYSENIRNNLKTGDLKIKKWTRFVRISEMELRDNFGCMSEFISRNP
jgi:hypothetical protein